MPKPLTIEEHKALSAAISSINKGVIEMMEVISQHYGKTKLATGLLQKVHALINRLQSELEDQMYRDHPGEARTNIYYN